MKRNIKQKKAEKKKHNKKEGKISSKPESKEKIKKGPARKEEHIHEGKEEKVFVQKAEEHDYKNKIESLLFSAGKKLELELITSLIGSFDKNAVKNELERLKSEYEEKKSSLMIVQDGNFWKITVREKYLPIVRKIVADTELSKSVMETLAVIAWKSPVLQSEVIKIRTNKAYDHIEELLTSGFITKEKKGRSFIIKVAAKFYEYFDVQGADGIKDVFSKINEAPVQRKAEEFKSEEKMEVKNIGKLEVVDAKAPENIIMEAEEDMERQKLGKLEVYETEGEKTGKKEEMQKNISKESVEAKEIEENKEKEDAAGKNEETLEKKTKKIVKELLEEDLEDEEDKKIEEE